MLISREAELRLQNLVGALTSSYAVYMIGRDLGQSMLGAARNALSTSAGARTFLEQSYLAGKLAGQLGTGVLRTMSEVNLVQFLRDNPITLSQTDRLLMEQLRSDTERWLMGRNETWQQEMRGEISRANQQWRASLQQQSFTDAAARSLFRNAALQNVIERLQGKEDAWAGDTSKLIQSEMATYFQRGQVADADPDEYVYKVPRQQACKTCISLHLDSQGGYRIYQLREVQGNSNAKLPQYAWSFTIGPVHPWCYCILKFADQEPPPNSKVHRAKWAQIRYKALNPTKGEPLKKSLAPALNGCGLPDDPMLMFEEQIKYAHPHYHKLPRHIEALRRAIQRVYQEKE